MDSSTIRKIANKIARPVGNWTYINFKHFKNQGIEGESNNLQKKTLEKLDRGFSIIVNNSGDAEIDYG